MSRVTAIKTFFERDGGRRVTLDELRALNDAERQELAELCAKELGQPLDA